MSLFELYSKVEYEGKMDGEVLPLCNALNALPFIKTVNSCCGHGSGPLRIFFTVGERKEGLFFLTRCVDCRYWKYGYLWKLELSAGDAWDGKNLPITYVLSSGVIVGDLAYEQAQSLIKNMNLHINHKSFMQGYDLELSNFKVRRVIGEK
jgi:hypothetical protein